MRLGWMDGSISLDRGKVMVCRTVFGSTIMKSGLSVISLRSIRWILFVPFSIENKYIQSADNPM